MAVVTPSLDLSTLKSGPLLVTGHTGFKGTWLTLLLENLGIEVVGLSLPAENQSLYNHLSRIGKINEFFIDVRSNDKIQEVLRKIRPANVLHLAAQPLVLSSYETPRETFETNVMGTVNLLDACCQIDSVRKVGIITTDKVYKNSNANTKHTEDDPLLGFEPYSASKVAAENVAIAWRQIIRQKDGPVIQTYRAGNVIGGGDFAENRLLPDIVRAIQENSQLELRNPASTRPWQHVLDPLSGYLRAMSASPSSKIPDSLNFGPKERELSVQEVVEIAQSKVSHPLRVTIVNDLTIKEEDHLALDSQLASQTLGWRPLWDQRAAILDTIEWWEKVNSGISAEEACRSDIEKILSKF